MKTGPRVLLFDIETSPNIAYIWGKYEQDALGDFVKERQIISVAWKWLGQKEVHALSLPMYPEYKKDRDNNERLVLAIHALFSEADVLIGHNVREFDIRFANAEFLAHGLKPPPPYKSVDTLLIARSKFRFNSNKLGDLGKRLGLGEKVTTGGFGLWAGCLRGDRKSWDKMVEYNKQDVVLLEKVYLKLRPWATTHPNMNEIDQSLRCPSCRSVSVQRRGWSTSSAGRVPRMQCTDCGKWFRAIVKKTGPTAGLRYRQ